MQCLLYALHKYSLTPHRKLHAWLVLIWIPNYQLLRSDPDLDPNKKDKSGCFNSSTSLNTPPMVIRSWSFSTREKKYLLFILLKFPRHLRTALLIFLLEVMYASIPFLRCSSMEEQLKIWCRLFHLQRNVPLSSTNVKHYERPIKHTQLWGRLVGCLESVEKSTRTTKHSYKSFKPSLTNG